MIDQPIKVGLVDFSWISSDQSPAEALRETLALGEHAEKLGFSRYWLGEHHVQGHASGSPQILAGILAMRTSRIRIGVAAMLLHYWAPLKLVEDFLLLEELFRRIDLGVARGRADNLRSHRALLDGRPIDDEMLDDDVFGAKLEDIVGHLRGSIEPDHPHYGAAVIPNVAVIPEVWVCGAAGAAPHAARTGVRFCCTLFHGLVGPPTNIMRYKEAFQPSEDLHEPYAAIAVAGVCADTEAEAKAMSEAFPNPNYVQALVGAPEQCKSTIERFCVEYGVNDVIILDTAPDKASRMRSAELLATAMELEP